MALCRNLIRVKPVPVRGACLRLHSHHRAIPAPFPSLRGRRIKGVVVGVAALKYSYTSRVSTGLWNEVMKT